ncbi:MAG: sulfatase-like hydrolase/transferase, partial [Actinomycetota bacterium]|nr:sulfatase-like hydrolase/transferase [Actinomycetota bacterium]
MNRRNVRTLTRREFLKAAGAGALLLGAAGCSRTEVLPDLPNKIRNLGGENANVVLVIIDSLRTDHVGAFGNDWIETPNLDALAKESLRFTKAYPESLPTICARRAIHTGMRTFPFRDRPRAQRSAPVRGWLPIPEEQPTLAEILRGHGYLTMLITDTYHEFMPPMNFHRGFEAYHFFRGQENDHYED